jgi:hypothetical protein
VRIGNHHLDVEDVPVERSGHRFWMYLIYVIAWAIGTVAIGVPVLAGVAGILSRIDPVMRIVFYLMPAVLSAMLVLGVLQIIAMYRYWFGPR